MALLEDLLERGYFPIQLPPAFSTKSFAANLAAYQGALSGATHWTHSERFSVPKSSYYRRTTSILNPVGYYRIARDIAHYWAHIQAHYGASTYSTSKPAHLPGVRAIEITKFSELHEKKIAISSGYKYALITDVSRYFPTIYTHSIPWAIHTKPVAKAHKAPVPAYYGNILDQSSRQGQDGQTMGIPIGPDTSHILAEVVGVAIDKAVQNLLGGTMPAGFRYVDDFFMCFNEHAEAENALAAVTRALAQFELQINPGKTRIVEVSDLVQESWRYSLKKLKISPKKKKQRDDIHHFFESMLGLEKRFKDESLVKYGLKQISSAVIKVSNWSVFESYLLRCAFSFPNTLQTVAHILVTYHHHGYPLDLSAVARFCNATLVGASNAGHHAEVAWCLWICKELEIAPAAHTISNIEAMESSVCALLALDLFHSGGLPHNLSNVFLGQFAAASALSGPNWLLAYEAGRRGWLPEGAGFIHADPYFGPMLGAGVEFYVETATLPPIFEVKAAVPDLDFDSDEDIADDLEFDEMDEEYFDAHAEVDEEGLNLD